MPRMLSVSTRPKAPGLRADSFRRLRADQADSNPPEPGRRQGDCRLYPRMPRLSACGLHSQAPVSDSGLWRCHRQPATSSALALANYRSRVPSGSQQTRHGSPAAAGKPHVPFEWCYYRVLTPNLSMASSSAQESVFSTVSPIANTARPKWCQITWHLRRLAT